MSTPVTCQDVPVDQTSPGPEPFILVSMLMFLGALFLFFAYLIGTFFALDFKFNLVNISFFLSGSRIDTRRDRRMPPRLLGRGIGIGSSELVDQTWADTPSGGIQRQEEAEVGSNCEAAPFAEGEEDLPPPYAEVAGAGAVFQFVGENGETFV